jgi:hypothetical protein
MKAMIIISIKVDSLGLSESICQKVFQDEYIWVRGDSAGL